MSPLPRYLRSLPQLMPLTAAELADRSLYGRGALVAKLAHFLRAERSRGLAGHWSYDLPRHAALFAIYRREKTNLQRDLGKPPSSGGNPAAR